jgi:uncharacterized membrane protein YfcA
VRDVGNWPTVWLLAPVMFLGAAVALLGYRLDPEALTLAAIGALFIWRGRAYVLAECPHCRERVPQRATACRHCGRDLP